MEAYTDNGKISLQNADCFMQFSVPDFKSHFTGITKFNSTIMRYNVFICILIAADFGWLLVPLVSVPYLHIIEH